MVKKSGDGKIIIPPWMALLVSILVAVVGVVIGNYQASANMSDKYVNKADYKDDKTEYHQDIRDINRKLDDLIKASK